MLPDNELAQMSILQTMFHFGNYDYISSVRKDKSNVPNQGEYIMGTDKTFYI